MHTHILVMRVLWLDGVKPRVTTINDYKIGQDSQYSLVKKTKKITKLCSHKWEDPCNRAQIHS